MDANGPSGCTSATPTPSSRCANVQAVVGGRLLEAPLLPTGNTHLNQVLKKWKAPCIHGIFCQERRVCTNEWIIIHGSVM